MKNDEEMKMTHSAIFPVKGKPHVSVVFERGNDAAEGRIPECRITKSEGFSKEETEGLERYLRTNSDEIFRRAKSISNIKHWLK